MLASMQARATKHKVYRPAAWCSGAGPPPRRRAVAPSRRAHHSPCAAAFMGTSDPRLVPSRPLYSGWCSQTLLQRGTSKAEPRANPCLAVTQCAFRLFYALNPSLLIIISSEGHCRFRRACASQHALASARSGFAGATAIARSPCGAQPYTGLMFDACLPFGPIFSS
jgi:hypothetical protein